MIYLPPVTQGNMKETTRSALQAEGGAHSWLLVGKYSPQASARCCGAGTRHEAGSLARAHHIPWSRQGKTSLSLECGGLKTLETKSVFVAFELII